jgi:hypothetical protein
MSIGRKEIRAKKRGVSPRSKARRGTGSKIVRARWVGKVHGTIAARQVCRAGFAGRGTPSGRHWHAIRTLAEDTGVANDSARPDGTQRSS